MNTASRLIVFLVICFVTTCQSASSCFVLDAVNHAAYLAIKSLFKNAKFDQVLMHAAAIHALDRTVNGSVPPDGCQTRTELNWERMPGVYTSCCHDVNKINCPLLAANSLGHPGNDVQEVVLVSPTDFDSVTAPAVIKSNQLRRFKGKNHFGFFVLGSRITVFGSNAKITQECNLDNNSVDVAKSIGEFMRVNKFDFSYILGLSEGRHDTQKCVFADESTSTSPSTIIRITSGAAIILGLIASIF